MKDIFSRLISGRYSCRAYSPEVPAEEKIDYILEAARLAPSACNRQPWRFIVIPPTDAEGRRAVAAAYSREWIATAPYYIVVCGVPAEGWVRPFDNHSHIDVDASIATEHMCLAATAEGLATCWVCNFDPAVLAEGLGLDAELVPIVILPVGYPAEGSKVPAKTRKASEDIIIRR